RPDVGRNTPAIAHRDLRGIIQHDAESVGRYVEEVTDRSLLQPRDVIGRRLARESARRDDTVPVTYERVAGRAVNVVTFAPTLQHFPCDRERHVFAVVVSDLAGIEVVVDTLVPARHGAFNQR